MVRLVNLLMRDEGPETAFEEIEEPTKLESATVLVSAEGKEVKTASDSEYVQHVPQQSRVPPPQVDSEDEDEMLIEV